MTGEHSVLMKATKTVDLKEYPMEYLKEYQKASMTEGHSVLMKATEMVDRKELMRAVKTVDQKVLSSVRPMGRCLATKTEA